VLEVLAEHPGLSICVITKGPLITRDIDVLRRINRISKLSLHISLITVDRELARRLEPRAPTPEARLRAVGRLRENDLETGINVMPVLPGITDREEQLEAVVQAVAARGASYVGACALRLQASARLRYLPFIEQEFPHLAKRYRATYAFDDNVSDGYSERLRDTMRALCDRHGVAYGYGIRSDRTTAESRLVAAVVEQQLELGLTEAGSHIMTKASASSHHVDSSCFRFMFGIVSSPMSTSMPLRTHRASFSGCDSARWDPDHRADRHRNQRARPRTAKRRAAARTTLRLGATGWSDGHSPRRLPLRGRRRRTLGVDRRRQHHGRRVLERRSLSRSAHVAPPRSPRRRRVAALGRLFTSRISRY
jgi:hypothetical protein